MEVQQREERKELGPGVPKLAELSEEHRQQALERYRMLEPCLMGGVSQAELARVQQMSLSTVQRWVRAYRQRGLAGLARQGRSDRGKRRSLCVEYEQVIEGLALQRPKRSIAEIHRQATVIAQGQGWPVVSYGQVYALVRGLDPGLVTLAQEGSRVYQERYDVVFLQEVSRPNERWQMDHCLLNIWLLNEQGQAQRPYLTVVLDDYSRVVMGYRLSFAAPSAIQTALTLRQAIWRKEDPQWPVCGIPESLYTDHGSDFCSKHLEQVAGNLSVRLMFSQPGRPRGRGKIERFFRTIKQMVLPSLPGFIPAVRPGYRSARKKQRRKRGRQALAARGAKLTLAQFEERLHGWIVQTYHQRWSRTWRRRPLERWQAVKFLPRLPSSLQELDLLLCRCERTRVIRPEGIAFEGGRYLHEQFAGYLHETAVIRYDPADLRTLAVYLQETSTTERFLCTAVRQEGGEQQISLQALVSARNERRWELHAQVRARQEALEQTQTPGSEQKPSEERIKRKPPAFLQHMALEFVPKES